MGSISSNKELAAEGASVSDSLEPNAQPDVRVAPDLILQPDPQQESLAPHASPTACVGTPSAPTTSTTAEEKPEGMQTKVPPSDTAAPDFSNPAGLPDRMLFKPDSTSLAQLAQKTSVVIATLLTIPDAFALIPGAKSVVGWVLNLIGNWVSAAVLWFVGFLAVLHLVRFIVRGVEVSNGCVKMWRFARPVAWSKVDAIGVEPQTFFTKLFRLHNTARRLTIFEKKKARGGTFKLLPHYLPSFYFTPVEFENLCRCSFAKKFAYAPTSIDVFVASDGTLPAFQKMFGHLRWQRVLVSILITVGLTMWLYRKATVNYAYNSGNKAMSHADYPQAEKLYQWAIATEPTFAPAWNMLGNAEYHLSDLKKAREHWRKALFLKPDFVEPRISLSHLAAQEGNYTQARELLDSALNLNPLNVYALVNRADLELSSGQVRDAVTDARIVMTQGPAQGAEAWARAVCLLARGKLRLGQPREAKQILDALPPLPQHAQPGLNAVNDDLRLNVSGETAFALGKLDQAQRYFQAARNLNQANATAVFGMATVEVAKRDFAAADKDIARSEALMPRSPGPKILYARSQFLQGHQAQAHEVLGQVTSTPNIDSTSLIAAGALYADMEDNQNALTCAQRTLAADPENHAARTLIDEITGKK